MKSMLFVVLAILCSIAKAAPPTLGADCGVGATIEATSSRDAGRVRLGTDPIEIDSCTLTFSWPGGKAPSCFAMFESSDPYNPGFPYATTTTSTTLRVFNEQGRATPMDDFSTFSYGCIGR